MPLGRHRASVIATRKATSDPDITELGSTLKRGAMLSAAALLIVQIVSFVQTLVLARVLSPQEIGIYAAGTVMMGFLLGFSEGGLRGALVQREDDMEDASDTVFWVTFGAGLGLAVLSLVASPIIGHLFNDDLAGTIAAVSSGAVVLHALTNVPDGLMQRRFNFKRRLVVDPARVLGYAIVTITLAVMGFGVWSMVIGNYVGITIWLLLSWRYARWRPGVGSFRFGLWREMAKFAFPLLVEGLVERVRTAAETALVGRRLDANNLGQYRYGQSLAQLPSMVIVQIGSYVLFPAFSRLQGDPPRFARAFERALQLTWVLAAPFAGLMIAIGEPAVVVLLGEKWRGAGVALMVMSGYGVGIALQAVGSEVVKAVGASKMLNWTTGVSLVLGIGSLLALLPLGLVGVGIAMSVTEIVVGLVILVLVRRVVRYSVPRMVWLLVPPAIAAAVAMAATWYVDRNYLHADEHGIVVGILVLVVETILFAVLYLIVLTAIAPTLGRTIFGAVRAKLRRGGADDESDDSGTDEPDADSPAVVGDGPDDLPAGGAKPAPRELVAAGVSVPTASEQTLRLRPFLDIARAVLADGVDDETIQMRLIAPMAPRPRDLDGPVPASATEETMVIGAVPGAANPPAAAAVPAVPAPGPGEVPGAPEAGADPVSDTVLVPAVTPSVAASGEAGSPPDDDSPDEGPAEETGAVATADGPPGAPPADRTDADIDADAASSGDAVGQAGRAGPPTDAASGEVADSDADASADRSETPDDSTTRPPDAAAAEPVADDAGAAAPASGPEEPVDLFAPPDDSKRDPSVTSDGRRWSVPTLSLRPGESATSGGPEATVGPAQNGEADPADGPGPKALGDTRGPETDRPPAGAPAQTPAPVPVRPGPANGSVVGPGPTPPRPVASGPARPPLPVRRPQPVPPPLGRPAVPVSPNVRPRPPVGAGAGPASSSGAAVPGVPTGPVPPAGPSVPVGTGTGPVSPDAAAVPGAPARPVPPSVPQPGPVPPRGAAHPGLARPVPPVGPAVGRPGARPPHPPAVPPAAGGPRPGGSQPGPGCQDGEAPVAPVPPGAPQGVGGPAPIRGDGSRSAPNGRTPATDGVDRSAAEHTQQLGNRPATNVVGPAPQGPAPSRGASGAVSNGSAQNGSVPNDPVPNRPAANGWTSDGQVPNGQVPTAQGGPAARGTAAGRPGAEAPTSSGPTGSDSAGSDSAGSDSAGSDSAGSARPGDARARSGPTGGRPAPGGPPGGPPVGGGSTAGDLAGSGAPANGRPATGTTASGPARDGAAPSDASSDGAAPNRAVPNGTNSGSTPDDRVMPGVAGNRVPSSGTGVRDTGTNGAGTNGAGTNGAGTNGAGTNGAGTNSPASVAPTTSAAATTPGDLPGGDEAEPGAAPAEPPAPPRPSPRPRPRPASTTGEGGRGSTDVGTREQS